MQIKASQSVRSGSDVKGNGLSAYFSDVQSDGCGEKEFVVLTTEVSILENSLTTALKRTEELRAKIAQVEAEEEELTNKLAVAMEKRNAIRSQLLDCEDERVIPREDDCQSIRDRLEKFVFYQKLNKSRSRRRGEELKASLEERRQLQETVKNMTAAMDSLRVKKEEENNGLLARLVDLETKLAAVVQERDAQIATAVKERQARKEMVVKMESLIESKVKLECQFEECIRTTESMQKSLDETAAKESAKNTSNQKKKAAKKAAKERKKTRQSASKTVPI